MKRAVIAIDGPAAAGKSTIARKVAQQLGYTYIDTGAMYRAVTLQALKKGISLQREEDLQQLLQEMKLRLQPEENMQRVFIDDEDVTEALRSSEVTNAVSTVAQYSKVREIMVDKQRELASCGGVVMDGRDIGTEVLPNADIKIFMTASVEERAERRYLENQSRGIDTPLEDLQKEIAARDAQDMNREVSPLRQADDATLIDTTGQSIEEITEKIVQMTKELEV